jgi:hypothetical protein
MWLYSRLCSKYVETVLYMDTVACKEYKVKWNYVLVFEPSNVFFFRPMINLIFMRQLIFLNVIRILTSLR